MMIIQVPKRFGVLEICITREGIKDLIEELQVLTDEPPISSSRLGDHFHWWTKEWSGDDNAPLKSIEVLEDWEVIHQLTIRCFKKEELEAIDARRKDESVRTGKMPND